MLVPSQFHNCSLADPHTWQAPAQNAALLEESTRIGLDPSERRGECPDNGALEPRSHGTFLNVARQTRRQPSQLHYISRDHPNAHELTNHIRHGGAVVAQVVWDCPRVTNWYNLQYSQDTLNLYYIQNRIFVVELVYNSRTN